MSLRRARRGVACVAGLMATAALLCGCESMPQMPSILPPPVVPGPSADSPPMVRVVPRKGQSGGVFVQEAAWSLTSDSRAFRPGDVVTIVLNETTQASKKADTSFGKQSNVGVQPSVLLGHTLKTDITVGAGRDFSGTSSSTQQNTLQGAITAVVVEVLPNGLLHVNGEKTLYLNQGEEFVRLTGYVRASDIDADNRISSQRIANARIAYSGQGSLADSNSTGWLMRFFTGPLMPF